MAVPTSSDPMGGKMSVIISNVEIPSFMIGSISASVSQLLRTSERLSGSTTTPSNQLDNPSYSITFYPNQWSDLQYFLPEYYDGASGTDGGSMVFGGSECSLPDPADVTLHYECEDGGSRDIHMPVTKVAFEDSTDRTATDDLSVTIHLYPQPNALGQIIYGPMLES